MDVSNGKNEEMIGSMQINSFGKKFFSPKELAEYLNISVHSVYLWVQLKKVPYHKLGKLVRFNLEEIDEWLRAKHIEPLNT